MKLRDLTVKDNVEGFDNFYIGKLSTNPFWSLSISPKGVYKGLLDFSIHESDGSFLCYAFKTSYYTHPVISTRFDMEVTIEEVINWINEEILKIKKSLEKF